MPHGFFRLQFFVRLFGMLVECAIVSGAAESATSKQPQLSVPDGFIVERVADDLGLRFPMFGAFADDGRLFVAESSGGDLHAELKTGTRNSRIRVLEDADGDGRFDTAQIFADRLVCPMGLAWRDGKLYVADPPDVIVLTDENADGRSDKRETILSGFGHETNGSLHGLIFGPDDMLYMTMGSPDGYALKRRDGMVLEGNSGALIRCRPDGADPEVLCRGFVNLIEVAFTARGDIIGTDNWYQEPNDGMRDALVHLVHGGLYPYLSDTGTRYSNTGILLPAIALYPAVAASGIDCYRGVAFPEGMRGELFSAQFNARKVVRHKLVPHGASFHSLDEDFVTTLDPDFHPSDVIESADGSLIVIDTGSWYVQHCPTGRIREVDATGGIYRIRYAAAAPVDDPWGREVRTKDMSPQQLAELLKDPRPAVRERARRGLATGGAASVAVLASVLEGSRSLVAKQHAIFALAGNRDPSALLPLRKALDASDPEMLIPAIRAVAMRRDAKSKLALERLLTHAPMPVRLSAAEGLADVGSSSTIAALWQAIADTSDSFLEHALIYAADRLAETSALSAALQQSNPKVQKAALLLLDQRSPTALEHQTVVTRLNAPNSEIRRTARDILARHPEWASHSISFLRQWLMAPEVVPQEQVELGDLLRAFQDDEQVQALIASAIRNENGKFQLGQRQWLLEHISRTTLPKVPPVWVESLACLVDRGPPDIRLAAVRCAAVLQIGELDDRLRRLAKSPTEPSELRREALRATVRRHPLIPTEAFRLLIEDLSDDGDPLLRLAAAETFGKTKLDSRQLTELLRNIKRDGLITPAVLLPTIERSVTANTSHVVSEYLEASIGDGWRPELDAVAGIVDKLEERDKGRLETALQSAQGDISMRQSRLAEVQPLLEGGNAMRGRAVFLSKKAACATCHRVGAEGGQIGPDLTRIGAIRAGRDMIESIVYPSSTIAQEYDQYEIVTVEGRVMSGILTEQTANSVFVRDSSGAETRLHRDEIAEINRQPTSMMPEGLDRLLTREEMRDLLAFLQGQK
jgi:putative membrane-bound dehydrogenase-like protein